MLHTCFDSGHASMIPCTFFPCMGTLHTAHTCCTRTHASVMRHPHLITQESSFPYLGEEAAFLLTFPLPPKAEGGMVSTKGRHCCCLLPAHCTLGNAWHFWNGGQERLSKKEERKEKALANKTFFGIPPA